MERNTDEDMADLFDAIDQIISNKGALDDAAAFNRIAALFWVRTQMALGKRLTEAPIPRNPVPRDESPC